LLKQSEQQHAFHNGDRQQVDRARKEAEALFRPKPKPKIIEPSILTSPSPANPSARKPRVLSASLPSLGCNTTQTPISAKPQIAVSASQFARINRERLHRARAAIFKHQCELQAKLNTIDSELRAIDAYEAAKKRKPSLGHRRSKQTFRHAGVTKDFS